MTVDEEIDKAFDMFAGELERPLGTQSVRQVMAVARSFAKSLVRQERSECAKVCDAMSGPGHSGYRGDADNEDCAAAIRARGD
jgi:hypothetical protein